MAAARPQPRQFGAAPAEFSQEEVMCRASIGRFLDEGRLLGRGDCGPDPGDLGVDLLNGRVIGLKAPRKSSTRLSS